MRLQLFWQNFKLRGVLPQESRKHVTGLKFDRFVRIWLKHCDANALVI